MPENSLHVHGVQKNSCVVFLCMCIPEKSSRLECWG